MKLSLKYDEITKALATLMPIVSDRLLADDLKNVTIHLKEDTAKLVATSVQITSSVDISVIGDIEYNKEELKEIEDTNKEKEFFVQIRAKELENILATFKTLKRTKVDKITLDVGENVIIMNVSEVPNNTEMENAEKYNRVTKFRIVRVRLRGILLDEIRSVQNKPTSCVELPTVELLMYINALLPNIKNEKRDAFNTINFSDKYIYTTSASYVAVMSNKFEEELDIACLSGFRLQNSKADFIKSFINDIDTIEFTRAELQRGGVLLTIVKKGAIATIKCPDMLKIRDISTEISDLSELKGIEIDKVYLLDVLKRVKLASDIINIEIDTTNMLMKLKSKTVIQELPILKNTGDKGIYKFTLKADVIDSLIFAHTNIFSEIITMSFRPQADTITLICTDTLELWQTVIKGLPQQELRTDW